MAQYENRMKATLKFNTYKTVGNEVIIWTSVVVDSQDLLMEL